MGEIVQIDRFYSFDHALNEMLVYYCLKNKVTIVLLIKRY